MHVFDIAHVSSGSENMGEDANLSVFACNLEKLSAVFPDKDGTPFTSYWAFYAERR